MKSDIQSNLCNKTETKPIKDIKNNSFNNIDNIKSNLQSKYTSNTQPKRDINSNSNINFNTKQTNNQIIDHNIQSQNLIISSPISNKPITKYKNK